MAQQTLLPSISALCLRPSLATIPAALCDSLSFLNAVSLVCERSLNTKQFGSGLHHSSGSEHQFHRTRSDPEQEASSIQGTIYVKQQYPAIASAPDGRLSSRINRAGLPFLGKNHSVTLHGRPGLQLATSTSSYSNLRGMLARCCSMWPQIYTLGDGCKAPSVFGLASGKCVFLTSLLAANNGPIVF
jgi:hypothetical protein